MKLWGGRFQKASDRRTEEFNASIAVDKRMYRQDIRGSQAHARMLAKQGILTGEEKEQIVSALTLIEEEIEQGILEFTVEAEDVHMNIETFLIAKIGDVGKKLHTARSRNDQVALDLRLYLRDEIKILHDLLLDTIDIFLKVAKEHRSTILPGYTHLQKAQPITLGHYMCAYVQMLMRDVTRLGEVYAHTGAMPLGSGALAGTGFPLDRDYVAAQLGFDTITLNSLDGVSDRDFAVEFCSMASILMMHLSRFCEELVLWSSDEFKFVELDDAFTTGSSIMPQKKNPDLAELIRGKTGRVYGDLMTLLTLMKGLPLAYNKDMQEDKEAVFDALDTVTQCLLALGAMVATARYQPAKMLKEASAGFTNATDLADYLVEKGIPFRDAHAIVGRAVISCLEQGIGLEELPLSAYQELSSEIGEDIYAYIAVEACVARRKIPGGPAPEAVDQTIAISEKWLLAERSRYR